MADTERIEVSIDVQNCPFCGSCHEHLEVILQNSQYSVHCRVCGAWGPVDLAWATEREAELAWGITRNGGGVEC